MSLFASTATRVTVNTAAHVNQAIRDAANARIAQLAASPVAAIEARLAALDREWDIERCLETGAASLILTGGVLGTTVDRKWLLLSAGVAAFLLQHAVQGWCPPLPLLRRRGVRTADEINYERMTLRAILFARNDRAGAVDAEPFEPPSPSASASP